jgi:hypothetical protein
MSVDFPWYVHYLFAVLWSVGLILFTWSQAPDTPALVASLVQSVLGGNQRNKPQSFAMTILAQTASLSSFVFFEFEASLTMC